MSDLDVLEFLAAAEVSREGTAFGAAKLCLQVRGVDSQSDDCHQACANDGGDDQLRRFCISCDVEKVVSPVSEDWLFLKRLISKVLV